MTIASKNYVDGKMSNGSNSITVDTVNIDITGNTDFSNIVSIGKLTDLNPVPDIGTQLRIYPNTRLDKSDFIKLPIGNVFDPEMYRGVSIQTKNKYGAWNKDVISIEPPMIMKNKITARGITLINDWGQELIINSGSNTNNSFKISSRYKNKEFNKLPIEFYCVIWPKRGIHMQNSTITGLNMPTTDVLETDAVNRGFVSAKFVKTMELMDEKFQAFRTLVELQNEKLKNLKTLVELQKIDYETKLEEIQKRFAD